MILGKRSKREFSMKVLNHHYGQEQIWVENIHSELGDEKYSSLLASVEPQTQQIVDEALDAGMYDALETRELKYEP